MYLTDFPMILVMVTVAKTAPVTPPKNVCKKEGPVPDLVLKDTACAVLVRIQIHCYQNVSKMYLTVTIRCGETKSENCTYFEASGTESGACRVKICKCDPNVCQVHLKSFYA